MSKQLAKANTSPSLSLPLPSFLLPPSSLTRSTRSAFTEACKRQEDRYVPRARTNERERGRR